MQNDLPVTVSQDLATNAIAEDLETKRRLLEAVDDLRRGSTSDAGESSAHNPVSFGRPRKSFKFKEEALLSEIVSLRKSLSAIQSERDCLEEEVNQLEQKTLEALAEVCRLREELRSNALVGNIPDDWRAERKKLLQDLSQARQERTLLTDALTGSESEIARMAVTLDDIVRHLSL